MEGVRKGLHQGKIFGLSDRKISVSAAIMKNKLITFKIQDRPYKGETFLEFTQNLCGKLVLLR